MGREVRRVPATWQHPKDEKGEFISLYDGFNKDLAEWQEDERQWAKGLRRNWHPENGEPDWIPIESDIKHKAYEDWAGKCPCAKDYMPDWPEAERTHFQMYETCTEGTPISPVMATPEDLARWLADTRASAFAGMTASYEQWLATIKRGWAPSAISVPGKGFVSGVEAVGDGK